MNIVISGGARGIGRAVAEQFAAEGHSLFLCARNKAVLENTGKEIREKFPNCTVNVMAADLSEKVNADSFADWCLAQAIPDILINNAGGYKPGNIIDEADGTLEAMMNNNLFSAYYLTRKLVQPMINNGGGHIFNICSVASLDAYAGGGSYSISKFALNGFSKNLREELKLQSVKVTTVFPGAVLTDSWGDFDNSATPPPGGGLPDCHPSHFNNSAYGDMSYKAVAAGSTRGDHPQAAIG